MASERRRLVDILARTDGFCRHCEALCVLSPAGRCSSCNSPDTRHLTPEERARLKAEVIDPAQIAQLRDELNEMSAAVSAAMALVADLRETLAFIAAYEYRESPKSGFEYLRWYANNKLNGGLSPPPPRR